MTLLSMQFRVSGSKRLNEGSAKEYCRKNVAKREIFHFLGRW
jgi:hypothetical protein